MPCGPENGHTSPRTHFGTWRPQLRRITGKHSTRSKICHVTDLFQVAVAKVSSLKRLSVMIDPSHFRCAASSFPEAQLLYASLADYSTIFLFKSGSRIEVLDFGSLFNYRLDVETDENGHTWPNYSYRIGSITVDDQEDEQLRKIVAIPAPVASDGTHF